MAEVGRPSSLNEELVGKIRELFMEGKTWEEIAVATGESFYTIEGWRQRNYCGFGDKVELWKMERRLKKAEKNIDTILEITPETNTQLEVVSDMSKFVAETLGKKHYSKKVEQDLSNDGKPITFTIINYGDTANTPVQLHTPSLPAPSDASTGQREDQDNHDMATP